MPNARFTLAHLALTQRTYLEWLNGDRDYSRKPEHPEDIIRLIKPRQLYAIQRQAVGLWISSAEKNYCDEKNPPQVLTITNSELSSISSAIDSEAQRRFFIKFH